MVFEIAPPSLPDYLQVTAGNFNVTIKPVNTKPTSLGTQYEFYKGMSESEVLAQQNSLGRASILNDVNCMPDTEYWYGVQAVNSIGRSSLLVEKVTTKLKPEDILDLIGPEIPKLDWAKELSEMVEENTSNVVLLSDRAALVVNKDNRVSGITVTAGDEASAIDFLADFVSFSDPDTLERNLYWDNNRKALVLKGEIQLLDGSSVSSKSDLGNGAGGIFRLQTGSGAFPGDTVTANRLFTSAFDTEPGKDTVFTVYALNELGKITRIESKMYDGTSWNTPKLFIDGDLVALGTIKGDRLVAGTSINAPVIKGGLIEAGKVISQGSPPAFELLPDGTLNARKANISGIVNANGGIFNNVTINENCDVRGTIYANRIVGDISRAYNITNNQSIVIERQDYDRVLMIPTMYCSAGNKSWSVFKIDSQDVLTANGQTFTGQGQAWLPGGGSAVVYVPVSISSTVSGAWTLPAGKQITVSYASNNTNSLIFFVSKGS